MSSSSTSSQISRRYHRYRMQRRASAAVAEALRQAPNVLGQAKQHRVRVLARRMAACAATMVIKLQTPPNDASRIIYRNRRSCRSGLCMLCARIRASQANKRINQRLTHILVERPNTRFLFLTLTSRNVPIAAVAQAFTAQEQALGRFWRTQEIARAFTGHVTGIEVAIRKSADGWAAGVHSHSLASVHPDYFDRKRDLYLPQRRIVALWQRALRCDYSPICYVTAVPAGDAVRTSLRECVKYAVSPKMFVGKTVDPLVAVYLADALYRRRMTRFGGLFATTRRYRAAKAMKRAFTSPQPATET